MSTVLVIADQAHVSDQVTDRLLELTEVEPNMAVHVLVPATPVRDAAGDQKVDASAGVARATDRLASLLDHLGRIDVPVDGSVGDADPMRAAGGVIRARSVSRAIVCAPPLGVSRWINMDLPHRLSRRFDILVEHIVTEPDDRSTDDGPEPARVLLVEDQPADIELTTQALDQLPVDVELSVARNGAEALAHLRTYGVKAVDLVLLDLKMPIVDGHEFLEEAGAEFDMSELNVVVLTTSTSESDRRRAHDLGAGAYVVKDPDFEVFRETMDSLVAEVGPH